MVSLARDVPAGLVTAFAGVFHPVLLVYVDHPDGVQRVHSNFGDISWDGETWTGLGQYAQFLSPMEEGGLATSEATMRVAASLSGIMAERGKALRGKDVQIYLGATTTAGGNTLVSDPTDFFFGHIDSSKASAARQGDDLSHDMVLGIGIGQSARVGASISHSYEDQIARYPGDTGGRQLQNAYKNRINPKP